MQASYGIHPTDSRNRIYNYFTASKPYRSRGASITEVFNRFKRSRICNESILVLMMLSEMNAKRILLADDDPDDRDLLTEAIGEIDTKVEIETVKDGLELMKTLVLTTALPDLIVLDLNMPGKNGKECLVEIKKNKAWSSIPIVIYSTSSSEKDIDDTFSLGAQLYVTKPNSFSELVCAVKKIFSIDFKKNSNPDRKTFLLNTK